MTAESWDARNMRRIRQVGLVVFAVIAVAGQFWWAKPAGAGTRVLIGWADRICPVLVTMPQDHVTVADGAHRLDIAVLRRAVDAVTGDMLIEPEADGPDLLLFQRSLCPNQPPFVPRSEFMEGRVHRRVTHRIFSNTPRLPDRT